MNRKSSNPYYHIFYWIFVLLILTVVFGLSWGNNMAAFYFISMLLPIVLGTSYFFNYFLVPRYYMQKKYIQFAFYSFYTAIVSMYLEMIVLMFSYIYLGNFNFKNLGPNASNIFLLAALLYLLVFIGSFLLMSQQIRENQQMIQNLLIEKEKRKQAFLEIISNRKTIKILYSDILYIESLSDFIKIHTLRGQISSKEKISRLEEVLPDNFIRIHRSFIINKDKLNSFSSDHVFVNETQLNIGRTYRKRVKESLKR
ncbi:LytR/AlgR family response regulator transcription factor [Marinifilum sp. RC60d5]|uniref:LytR/AlgR family response regulator transcription factor n=1 Tax=Marinifilum sp. RC60d5 TaxID=3458414 RepID=UPI0040367542